MSYAAGFFDVSRLQDRLDRYLTVQEIETEREKITVFDGSVGNLAMNMLNFNSESYEGDERTYIDKDGDDVVSSHKPLLVAHISSAFDCWIVLNSLVEEITELKIVKTAREVISLSFRCGVKIVNTVGAPQYVIFKGAKSLIKGSLEKIGEDYGLQAELLKGEIKHSVNNKSNFADLRQIWEPYFKLDVICLAFINDRHSTEMQNRSGFGFKDSLIEASLGWKCL